MIDARGSTPRFQQARRRSCSATSRRESSEQAAVARLPDCPGGSRVSTAGARCTSTSARESTRSPAREIPVPGEEQRLYSVSLLPVALAAPPTMRTAAGTLAQRREQLAMRYAACGSAPLWRRCSAIFRRVRRAPTARPSDDRIVVSVDGSTLDGNQRRRRRLPRLAA